MHGQRPKGGFGRGRRRKARDASQGPPVEPIRIAARRPDSPLLAKAPPRTIAASAVPQRKREPLPDEPKKDISEIRIPAEPARRAARIVTIGGGTTDARELERQKLLRRLLECEGRGAISRAADEYLQQGFELPNEQPVHLQLLEHFDESLARTSMSVISNLLEEQSPLKKPVLDQRLRRLEEHAEEGPTRELAAELRRTLRA
jgi:hypothetical protein